MPSVAQHMLLTTVGPPKPINVPPRSTYDIPMAPVAPQTVDTVEVAPRHKNNRKQITLISVGVVGLVAIGAAIGAGVALNVRHSNTKGATPTTPAAPTVSTPPAGSGPNYNNSGITMVQAYNNAFNTSYENSAAGFASLKQVALGDFTTPQLFAEYACLGTAANTSCTLTQALQGNDQQVNLPLVIADEDLQQVSVSLTAECDSGTITTPETFVAPLPQAPQGNSSRGFFSVLNSADAACVSATGTPVYDFHYTLTAGNQTVGANNSLVLFKRNAAGQITNALIGVNQGDRTDPMLFNEPIYNLQTSY